jgi:hypothetical protein
VGELRGETAAEPDEGNGTHCYLTIYSLDEFKGLPQTMKAAATAQTGGEKLVAAVQNVGKLVDDAVKSYLKARRPFQMLMYPRLYSADHS